MNQLYLCLLLLFVGSSKQSNIECIKVENARTRTFQTLENYEGNKYSFNPRHPGYEGNHVDFSFLSINRLLKNSFLSFDSDYIMEMSLAGKGVQRIDGGAFLFLFCLRTLHLGHNQISNLTKEVFQGLQNLEHLDLSFNALVELPDMIFYYLNSLKNLNLSNNQLKLVSSQAFWNLSQLRVLNLGFNKLRNIVPDTFASLQDITLLDLNSNKLMESSPEMWTGLNNLLIMNLANNSLRKFDPSYNFSFAGITQLNLSSNYLTQMNVVALKKSFPQLATLDINDNRWNCEDLVSIQHALKDSRVVVIGRSSAFNNVQNISCSTAPRWIDPVTKAMPASPTTTTEKIVVPKTTPRDLSKELYVQNREIIYSTNQLMDKVSHVETMIVYVVVIVCLYIIITVSIHIGLCRSLYNQCSRRSSYFDNSDVGDAENLVTMRR